MLKIVFVLSLISFTIGKPTTPSPFDEKQSNAPWSVYMDILGVRCGGSLVYYEYVITAAHCFDKFLETHSLAEVNQIILNFGEWKLDLDQDCAIDNSEEVCDSVAEIPIDELIIHDEYDAQDKKNKHKYDIAIIKLERPPRITAIVNNAFLPEKNCEENLTEVSLMISGFGYISPQVFTNTRKKIDIEIFSHDKCKKEFKGKKYDAEKHICGAGHNGLSTCKGDSGSGAVRKIVTDNEERPYLIGIVSFGTDVCGDGKPTGLLKISCFIDWINKITNHVESETTTTTEATITNSAISALDTDQSDGDDTGL